MVDYEAAIENAGRIVEELGSVKDSIYALIAKAKDIEEELESQLKAIAELYVMTINQERCPVCHIFTPTTEHHEKCKYYPAQQQAHSITQGERNG